VKTLVLFYSRSGHTAALARGLAEREGCGVAEARHAKRVGTLRAFTAGTAAAMGGKAWPIEPIDADLDAYERLLLLAPVWAGRPAPAFNALAALLPPGKTVGVTLVSGGGKTSRKCKERIAAAVAAGGCTLEGAEDARG
jgi:flavodoxin